MLSVYKTSFPVLLAPMAGVSDLPYRALCMAMGADGTCTEMISAKGLCFGNDNTRGLLATSPNERPCAVQLFGREPAILAEAARRICGGEDIFRSIDVNMGCPARKITSNGEGSALMLEPRLAGAIVAAMVKASSLPITVKFRKGYDDAHPNAVEFARVLEQSGASALTVHGRTREQMYAGKADRDIIAAVKAAVRIPVIGNGDVYTGADALSLRKATGCDGVMVGRGAMGNPYIFREIKAALAGESYAPPSEAERLALAAQHAALLTQYKGAHGVIEMRKHIAWYVRGMRGATALRIRANACQTLEEMLSLLKEYEAELEKA